MKMFYSYILSGLASLLICGSSNATYCAFNLPPSEQIIVNGNPQNSKILSCKVKTDDQDNNHLLNFISETNTSVVNNLILPEGTIMSLSFSSLEKDRLIFELKAKARLGITNDSNEFIRLICDLA